VLTYS